MALPAAAAALAAYGQEVRSLYPGHEVVRWGEAAAAVDSALARLRAGSPPPSPAPLPQSPPAEASLAPYLARFQELEERRRLLASAAAWILADRWLDALLARMTDTYVKSLRARRNAVQKDLAAALAAAAQELEKEFVETAPPAPAEVRAALPAISRALTLGDEALLHAMVALLKKTAQAGCPVGDMVYLLKRAVLGATSGAPPLPPPGHPLLQMGETFGAVPAAEVLRAPPPGAEACDVALPRSRCVVYDLPTLLRGVSGTVDQGVNYQSAVSLETIRTPVAPAPTASPVAPGAPERADDAPERADDAPGSSLQYRQDAPGAYRAVRAQYSYAEMTRGPPPTLAAYHRLAEQAAAQPAVGFLIENTADVLRRFEEDQTEDARQAAEVAFVEKAAGDRLEATRRLGGDLPPLPAQVAAALADQLAAQRYTERVRCEERDALRPTSAALPGRRAWRREAALTAAIQASRLEGELERVLRGAAPRAGAAVRLPPDALGGERLASGSVKLLVISTGRPA